MKLKVIQYANPPADYHICRDEEGKTIRIDLMVDGALGGKYPDIAPQDIVGKTVTISWAHAHIMIGHDVEILEESND